MSGIFFVVAGVIWVSDKVSFDISFVARVVGVNLTGLEVLEFTALSGGEGMVHVFSGPNAAIQTLVVET